MQQLFTLLITLFKPLLKLLLPALIISTTLISGCGSSIPTIKPFKMDIQQGNVVTSKMLLQLKPGMTKSQVRFIMGTPLVVDSFHKDRWDYFYQMRQAGKIVEQRRVILDFEKELLTKVRGDVVPQGTAGATNGGADTGESNVVSAPITVEPRPKETTMWDKLKFWQKDEKPMAKTIAADAPLVAPVAVAVTSESKPEMAKESTEKALPEKSVPEKSLLDKLKFWKKDESAAAAEKAVPKVESPTIEVAAATIDAPSIAAPEAASVLAVPIELPSIETTTEAAPNEEPVVAEPLITEPLEATKTPSITGKDSLKPFKSPSQKMLPAKPEVIKPLLAKPAVPSSVFNKPPLEKPPAADSQLSRPLKPLPLSNKKDEKLIFRLDKNFDISRADEMKVELLPTAASPTPDIVSKPAKTEPEALPPETEPSFFDKMLEKIGF